MPTSKLQILSPTVAPPSPPPSPLPEPVPFISPTWALLFGALKFAGLPDAATIKRLDKLSVDFLKELDGLTGHSHNDARREFKALVNDAVAGKTSGELPTFQQIQHKHSIARRAVRQRASAISREACLLAAQVFEKVLATVPDYTEQLLKAESALTPGVAIPNTPLRRLLAELPNHIRFHIQKLRENPTPLVNPKNLLNLN